ncbi:MAG: hypothetical protein FJ265_07750 [Planctomycetes bacterium]|nr:hypothetical protein [Planctomycetota bacterium]
MRLLPCVLFALGLALPAKADRFWLSDPAAKTADGSAPNIIEGVLIAESDEGYHVRVVGGEVLLPKRAVFRIEKDALSIADIVRAEQELGRQAAAADAERQERAASRSAKQRARRTAAEASASKRGAENPPPAAPAPAHRPATPGYDPVLHRARPAAEPSRAELQADLQLAWTLTRDRRFLQALRRIRREN